VICSINAGLSETPTEILVFRDLTMDLTYDLEFDILIEVCQETKDSYYFYLKNAGLLDFIKEIVNEFEESGGIHIDYAARRPDTIVTDRINEFNKKKIYQNAAAFKS